MFMFYIGPNRTHPSDMFLSFSGIKTASALVRPTVLSFFRMYLINFSLLSAGTMGKPSSTTKVSKPSSRRTSYCAFRSKSRKSATEGLKISTKFW